MSAAATGSCRPKAQKVSASDKGTKMRETETAGDQAPVSRHFSEESTLWVAQNFLQSLTLWSAAPDTGRCNQWKPDCGQKRVQNGKRRDSKLTAFIYWARFRTRILNFHAVIFITCLINYHSLKPYPKSKSKLMGEWSFFTTTSKGGGLPWKMQSKNEERRRKHTVDKEKDQGKCQEASQTSFTAPRTAAIFPIKCDWVRSSNNPGTTDQNPRFPLLGELPPWLQLHSEWTKACFFKLKIYFTTSCITLTEQNENLLYKSVSNFFLCHHYKITLEIFVIVIERLKIHTESQQEGKDWRGGSNKAG